MRLSSWCEMITILFIYIHVLYYRILFKNFLKSIWFINWLICSRIFLSLMESAGLTDLLKQEGSYTLFAPVDASFGTLTEEDITLLKSKRFFPLTCPTLAWSATSQVTSDYSLIQVTSTRSGQSCSTILAMASLLMEDWRVEWLIFSRPYRATTFKCSL